MKRRLVVPALLLGVVGGLLYWQKPFRLETGPATADLTSTGQRPEPVAAALAQAPAEPAGVQYLDSFEQLPAWAVRYGGEFWHSQARKVQPAGGTADEPAFDVGETITRVSHTFVRGQSPGTAVARDQAFAAQFAGGGFTLSPNRFLGLEEQEAQGPTPAKDSAPGQSGAKRAKYLADPQTQVAFKTLRVQAGDQNLYQGQAAGVPWCVLGNTAQGLLHREQGLVEHYEVRPQGVEVSWVLQRPPAQGGDLTIEAQLAGLTPAGEEQGVHYFADAAGERRVQAGKVELVDAGGRRLPVPADWSGDTMRVQVAGEVLAQLNYPVAIDPLVGPAFGMMISLQPMAQIYPSMAWNGTNYLFVWEDYQTDGADHWWIAIRGTLVSSNGTVLNPGGFTIRDANLAGELSHECRSPAVASRGGEFLVVWQDWRDSMWVGVHNDLYGTLVSGTGVVRNPNGMLFVENPLSYDPEGGYASRAGIIFGPRLISAGGNFLAVWTEWRNDNSCGGCTDISGALLDGINQTSSFYIYTNSTRYEGPVDVCTDGTDYMVAWAHMDDSIGFHFFYDSTGVRVVQPNGAMWAPSFITNGIATRVASASSLGNFMVAYSEYDDWWEVFRVKGIRFNKSGAVLDPTPINIALGCGPDVTSDGTNYYVAYYTEPVYNEIWPQGEIYGKRIRGSSGTVMDTDRHLVSTSGHPWAWDNLEVICNGREFLVAWQDGVPMGDNEPNQYLTNDVWATRITLDNQPIKCAPVSVVAYSPASHTTPSVAHNNGTYFVAWQDYRAGGGNTDIYGVQLDAHGYPHPAAGLAICTVANAQEMPNVTALSSWSQGIYDGFFVSWADRRVPGNSDIYGARITATGQLLDPNGFVISTAPNFQSNPSATAIGETVLVVWQDKRSGAAYNIYGARVAANGTVLDPNGLVINNAAGSEQKPRLTSLNGNFFVVWMAAPDSINFDIKGARVTPAGVVLDTTPITIAGSATQEYSPQVSADPITAAYLVTWYGNSDIYAARVAEAGTLIDTTPISVCTAPSTQAYPSVARLGSSDSIHLIAWVDLRNGSGYDIYGARFDVSTGQVLDPNGFVIDASTGTQFNVSLAAANDRCLAVFQSSETGTTLVQGRFVFPTPAGPNSSLFVRVDDTTGPYWIGHYGALGYNVIGDTPSYPACFSSSISPNLPYDWPDDWPAGAPPGLQKPSNPAVTDRYCVHSPDNVLNGYFDVDLNFTDGLTHQVAFYVFDFDANCWMSPRVESITLLDAATGTELDSRVVDSFAPGKYYIYNLKGHLTARFTYLGGSWNSVMSGFFIDPVGTHP